MKKILVDSLRQFGAMVVACLCGYIIGNGVFGLIAYSVTENYLVFRIFYFIPHFIAVVGTVFLLSFRAENKRECFVFHEILISALIACALQLLASFVIGFTIYTSGPAIPIGQIIFAGADYNVRLLDTDVPKNIYVICMLILDVFYVASAVSGGYLGQKHREKTRAALQKEKAERG